MKINIPCDDTTIIQSGLSDGLRLEWNPLRAEMRRHKIVESAKKRQNSSKKIFSHFILNWLKSTTFG